MCLAGSDRGIIYSLILRPDSAFKHGGGGGGGGRTGI